MIVALHHSLPGSRRCASRATEAGRAAERLADLPTLTGNHVELLIDGEATFNAIFEGIASAKDYILVQFYIVRDDEAGTGVASPVILADGQNSIINVPRANMKLTPEDVEAAEPEDWDVLLLVSSWFRRHPMELERTLSPEQGRRLCIDAGLNRAGCTGNEKHCPPTQCPSQRFHWQDSL